MNALVTPSMLKEIAAARAVKDVRVVGDTGGYRVAVRYGDQVRDLASRTREGKNKPRTFRTLDTAARYLREIGLVHYQVDDSGYSPTVVKRPDRADALKRTHEAAAYDANFRSRVAAGVAQLDAGQSISNEAMTDWMASKKAELQKRIAATRQS